MNTTTNAKRPRAKAPEHKIANDEMHEIEARIYKAVFDSIMSQRLTPGAKLPDSALSELFGVSRTALRRVLEKFAHDRMVDLRPNCGAIVATPGPKETPQIFAAGRALESAILAGYLTEIVSRGSLIVALYQPWGNASCEDDEHTQIVTSMERSDCEGAAALMEDHLLKLERNICLRQNAPEPSLKQRLGL